jgi:hypothetical protein
MFDDQLDLSKQGFAGKPSFATLLEGLIRDIKTLIAQEIKLAKDEIRVELAKIKTAVLSVALGIGLATVGGLLFIAMAVHLLQAVSQLPLWACYGIVGGVLAGAAAILLLKAKANISAVHIAPQNTMATMKENATWIKEQVTSQKT